MTGCACVTHDPRVCPECHRGTLVEVFIGAIRCVRWPRCSYIYTGRTRAGLVNSTQHAKRTKRPKRNWAA